MPHTTVLPTDTPALEPVDVADAVAEWRLQGVVDLESQQPAALAERALIARKLKAARELVEGFTGSYFAGNQTLELTYRLDEPYELPAGAQVVAVRGFFTNEDALVAWNWEEYRKGITVNREWDLSYAASQTYTVTVTLPESVAEATPARVVEAILELGGEFYRNRETTSSTSSIPRELPVSYRVKLADLVRKPVLF